MAHLAFRSHLGRAVIGLGLATSALSACPDRAVPHAGADATAYLIAVVVRPGYNFASSADALEYGHGVCDKVAGGRGYGQLLHEIEVDFNTSDEYQAQYLVNQAVDNLCPALIWQLRSSADHYVPPVTG